MKPDSIRVTRQAKNRTTLLVAAKVLFEAHGYESATMREIARAAGVSTGAVFSNWAGKAELYREIYGHDPITPEQGRKLVEVLRAYGVAPDVALAA